MSIAAFTTICEEDTCWIDNYLKEVERLEMPFAIHLDRCSDLTKERFTRHPLCIGCTVQDNLKLEYTEQHKQGVFDILCDKGYSWGLSWDIDETYAKDAPELLPDIEQLPFDLIDTKWINLWGDTQHIRLDGPFSTGHRIKFYRLTGGKRWKFDHPITYGCKLVAPDGTTPHDYGKVGSCMDFVCIHWGLMTPELRQLHLDRWNRIYTKAVGANPYGFWNYTVDASIEPLIVPNPYM